VTAAADRRIHLVQRCQERPEACGKIGAGPVGQPGPERPAELDPVEPLVHRERHRVPACGLVEPWSRDGEGEAAGERLHEAGLPLEGGGRLLVPGHAHHPPVVRGVRHAEVSRAERSQRPCVDGGGARPHGTDDALVGPTLAAVRHPRHPFLDSDP